MELEGRGQGSFLSWGEQMGAPEVSTDHTRHTAAERGSVVLRVERRPFDYTYPGVTDAPVPSYQCMVTVYAE